MSIQFCCDLYQAQSLKASERQHRAGGKPLKTYEVRDGFEAPDPAEFFAVFEFHVNPAEDSVTH